MTEKEEEDKVEEEKENEEEKEEEKKLLVYDIAQILTLHTLSFELSPKTLTTLDFPW